MKNKLLIFIFFLTFYDVSASVAENDPQEDYLDYNENIYRKYIMMDKQIKSMTEQGVKMLLPYLLEAQEHVNISSTCARNLFDLIIGLRKLTNWSLNFMDAMGKLQSGIQTGNIQMFGEYEECIETTVMKKGKVDFQGQYCRAIIKPYLPKVKKIPGLYNRLSGLINATRKASDFMKIFASRAHIFYAFDINMGLCVPSGCSKQDMSEILNYTIGDYLNTTVTHCIKEGDIYYWTTFRIIIVSFYSLIGGIALLSTLLDNTLETWKNNKLGFKSKILQCFSLTRNFPKLMNTATSEKSISCLNGIRVLTIFWIILGHEFYFHAMSLTANHSSNYEKMLTNFFSQIPLNAFLSVDVFFFMSGFVNCYSRMLIKQEGKSQPGIFKLIFHRLWRIYPAYIIAFLLMFLLMKPQPFSYGDLLFEDKCNLYWWRNIFFINNIFGFSTLCFTQSWFLCVDMQLFLATLFTVPFFLSKPKKAIILHVAMILAVNLCSMSWWFVGDGVPPETLDGAQLDIEKAMVKGFEIYGLPFVHVGSYTIGIILGYIIATKKEIKIRKVTQLIGWISASIFFTSMLFMSLRWNSGIPYLKLESALYGAWHRTIFILGFSWLVFCCATGHARLINYILSLNLWIPLSRITYMIYLVSPSVQAHYYSHVRFPEDFSEIRLIWNYFADMSISVFMSFAIVLIAESPMVAVEKILFRKNKDDYKSSSEVEKELTFSNMKENGFRENNGNVITIHL